MARLHGLSFILLSATLAVRAADGYTDPNSNGGSMLTVRLHQVLPNYLLTDVNRQFWLRRFPLDNRSQ